LACLPGTSFAKLLPEIQFGSPWSQRMLGNEFHLCLLSRSIVREILHHPGQAPFQLLIPTLNAMQQSMQQ